MPLAIVLFLSTAVVLVLLLISKLRVRNLEVQIHEAQASAAQASAAEQQARARVQAAMAVEERYRGVTDLEVAITELRAQRTTMEADHTNRRVALDLETKLVTTELGRLRHELAALTDEEYFADFGVYSTRYDFPTSEAYKAALDVIRDRQKAAVKAGTAAVCHIPWTVEGSAAKGKKMTNDNLKLMLRAFNGECDASITKVTYKNIAAIEARIRKSKERIDRLNAVNQAEITHQYLQLKLEELRLFYEYARKKEAERQEQRELKEQIREEKQAQQELDRERKRAEAEESRYSAALAKAREDVQKAVGAKQAKMASKIADLEARLAEAQANKERAISQAQLTRAGYVYVISNIGSFGEGVLKIGMTRRFDPMDRVKELGDASVPFSFDVHAFIRSDDAPTLEKELHRRFDARRVNLVNRRKEFFRVSLDEVGAAVEALHGAFEITKLAAADDYRETVAILEDLERRAGAGAGAVMASHAVSA